jgi:hypothetical protein
MTAAARRGSTCEHRVRFRPPGYPPAKGVPSVPMRQRAGRRVCGGFRGVPPEREGVGSRPAVDRHQRFVGFCHPVYHPIQAIPLTPPLSKLDLFTRCRIHPGRILSEKTAHAPTHLDRIMALRATVWDSH